MTCQTARCQKDKRLHSCPARTAKGSDADISESPHLAPTASVTCWVSHLFLTSYHLLLLSPPASRNSPASICPRSIRLAQFLLTQCPSSFVTVRCPSNHFIPLPIPSPSIPVLTLMLLTAAGFDIRSLWYQLPSLPTSSSKLRAMADAVPHEPVLDLLVEVARKAGDMIARAQPHIQTTKKNSADLVTETDKAVEKFIIGELKERYPDYEFYGEETYVPGMKLSDRPTWVVDPIDGVGDATTTAGANTDASRRQTLSTHFPQMFVSAWRCVSTARRWWASVSCPLLSLCSTAHTPSLQPLHYAHVHRHQEPGFFSHHASAHREHVSPDSTPKSASSTPCSAAARRARQVLDSRGMGQRTLWAQLGRQGEYLLEACWSS